MTIVLEAGDSRLKAMLKSPFFAELLLVFQENKQPTLRELKAQLTDSKLDRKIDFLVKEKIILRSERRYSLALSKVGGPKPALYDQVKHQLIQLLEAKTKEARLLTLYALYPEEPLTVPFVLAKETDFSYAKEIQNDLLSIVSLSTQNNAFCLPHYFNRALTQEERQGYAEVEGLLGDVDPNYYLDQVWSLLDKIEKKRRRLRTSIFLESLQIFGVVQENDEWSLTVPVYPLEEKAALLSLSEDLGHYHDLSLVEKRELLGELMQVFDLTATTLVFIQGESL